MMRALLVAAIVVAATFVVIVGYLSYERGDRLKLDRARMATYCSLMINAVGSHRAVMELSDDERMRGRAMDSLHAGPLGLDSRDTIELCAPGVDLEAFDVCHLRHDRDCLVKIARDIEHHATKNPGE